jgi:hypothetical protein
MYTLAKSVAVFVLPVGSLPMTAAGPLLLPSPPLWVASARQGCSACAR